MIRHSIGAVAALLALSVAGCAAQQPERPPAASAPSAATEAFDDPAAALAERKRLTKPMPLAPARAAAVPAIPTRAQPTATTQPRATSTAKPTATPKTWTRAQCEFASQADWIDNCRQYGSGLSTTSTKPAMVAPVPGKPLPRNAPPMDWDGCKPPSSGPPEVACH